MDILTYYKTALKKGLYLNREWIISLFTISDISKTKPYPYKLLRQADGYYYLDEKLKSTKLINTLKHPTNPRVVSLDVPLLNLRDVLVLINIF